MDLSRLADRPRWIGRGPTRTSGTVGRDAGEDRGPRARVLGVRGREVDQREVTCGELTGKERWMRAYPIRTWRGTVWLTI